MIQRPYLTCAVQLTSTLDLDDNLARAEALVARAVARGAELVGLPENFPQIGQRQEDVAARVSETHPRAEAWLLAQARRHQIVLYGGLIAPGPNGRVFNELVVAGRDGHVLARYRKRHLFDVAIDAGHTFLESASVEPGDEPVVVDLGDLGVLGLSICYDLRFPEHYRRLVDLGADLLTVPAAFLAVTGRDHWHVLLRARAIENTAYLLAPAQSGFHHADRESYGHALVIDPWGQVLAEAPAGEALALAEIDPARQAEVRRQLPCLGHRRDRVLPG